MVHCHILFLHTFSTIQCFFTKDFTFFLYACRKQGKVEADILVSLRILVRNLTLLCYALFNLEIFVHLRKETLTQLFLNICGTKPKFCNTFNKFHNQIVFLNCIPQISQSN